MLRLATAAAADTEKASWLALAQCWLLLAQENAGLETPCAIRPLRKDFDCIVDGRARGHAPASIVAIRSPWPERRQERQCGHYAPALCLSSRSIFPCTARSKSNFTWPIGNERELSRTAVSIGVAHQSPVAPGFFLSNYSRHGTSPRATSCPQSAIHAEIPPLAGGSSSELARNTSDGPYLEFEHSRPCCWFPESRGSKGHTGTISVHCVSVATAVT